jgi:hypothetical protein
MHLAELNIAAPKHPQVDPRRTDFIAAKRAARIEKD